MKTSSLSVDKITHNWFIVDADGLTLGRLAKSVFNVISKEKFIILGIYQWTPGDVQQFQVKSIA